MYPLPVAGETKKRAELGVESGITELLESSAIRYFRRVADENISAFHGRQTVENGPTHGLATVATGNFLIVDRLMNPQTLDVNPLFDPLPAAVSVGPAYA